MYFVVVVVVLVQADAQHLEMVKELRFGAGLGAPSREDRLREAAHIHIRLGNIQKYCEILVELGEVLCLTQVWDSGPLLRLVTSVRLRFKYFQELHPWSSSKLRQYTPESCS